jgi:putative ABC transport system ATP-binding protein
MYGYEVRTAFEESTGGAAGMLGTHEARHAGWSDGVAFLRDRPVAVGSGSLTRPEELLAAGGARR